MERAPLPTSHELGRIVSAPLVLEYDPASLSPKEFRHEYETLSEADDDPIGQWLKLAKARGETRESDTVVVNLLVELHRKIDEIKELLTHEVPTFLKLGHTATLRGIGHGVLLLESAVLTPGEEYYGRINLPVFPERVVSLYFKALDESSAKTVRMHERDIRDWDSYIVAKERAAIREQKRDR